MSNPLDANGVEALEPCPFCGAAFLIAQEPHDNHPVAGKFYIFHDYGPIGSAARSCVVDVSRHFDSREEAIALWNRRAPLASSHTAVEPVGELVERLRVDANFIRVRGRSASALGVVAKDLDAAAAALVAAEKERDEALDRVEELEAEVEAVSTEFEKDCWKAMRSLLDECNFDWSWVDQDDGVSAEEAREHISETINGIEGDRKAAVARAEAAESEVATLKARVAELEAGLGAEAEACATVADLEAADADALFDMHSAYDTLTDTVRARIAGRRSSARGIALNIRARRLTHQEKNNAG